MGDNQIDEKRNPWKTLESAQKYDNPWILVTEHKVLNPAGNPGIYGTVHFKNRAVGVVPYQGGKIWLVGQYRYVLESYSWEIPEGGCPAGEDRLEAAKRELKEETGITAGSYQALLEMDLSNSVSDEDGIVYLATDLEIGESDPDEDELLQLLELEEAFQWVEEGKIRDSLSVAAIYKMMLLKSTGKLPD